VRYWLVVAAAAPAGLLAGAILTTHCARAPHDPAPSSTALAAAAARTPAAETPSPTANPAATRQRNEAFVRAAYQDIFGSPPAVDLLDRWLTALDGGATRLQVAAALYSSPEYDAMFVNTTYQRLLGRAADADALAAWSAALKNGESQEQLIAGLLGSPEYFQHQGSSDAAWLDGAFKEMLHREPTPAERDSQLAALNAGAGRGDIADALGLGDEYRRAFLAAAFQQYLGRAPTAEEQRWLLGAMAEGRTSTNVRVALIGSDEYLRRHAA